jgi:hypothetical protein
MLTRSCLCAGILSGVAQRARAPEYVRLLGDCRGLYCEARLGLVAPVARARIAALAAQQLPALTRAGCAYLMQVTCWRQWQCPCGVGCTRDWHRHRHWHPPAFRCAHGQLDRSVQPTAACV